jgi:hypothetical protein
MTPTNEADALRLAIGYIVAIDDSHGMNSTGTAEQYERAMAALFADGTVDEAQLRGALASVAMLALDFAAQVVNGLHPDEPTSARELLSNFAMNVPDDLGR